MKMGLRTTRPRLDHPASFTSAARAELALAIAARDAHATTLATLDAAGPKLDGEADTAWETLQAATKAIETAQATAAEQAVAAAIAGASAPSGGVTAARAALQAAEDAYDVAKAALAALPARQAKAQEQAQELGKRVDRAAARVVGEHPFIAALAARVDAIQCEAIALTRMLNWARSSDVIPVVTFETTGPNIPPGDLLVNRAISRLTMQGRFWYNAAEGTETFNRLGAAKWAQALEDLKTDPQAALPVVEMP